MPKLKGRAGKSKKGIRKKAGKNGFRGDRESEAEKAKANAALWEARLKVTEFSRVEYRETARSLANNNELLTKHQYQLEKDMVDVIGFFKKQDMEKDELIEKLQQQLIAQKKLAQEERRALMDTYSQKIAEMEEKCLEKANEMRVLQREFKMIKEFRKRKVELENELDEIKEKLCKSNQEHKEALNSMERHFLEEKQRLEKEAEKKIMILAERAHNEAIMQLDEAGRSVFKENIRLKEAFSYHLSEVENLKKSKEQLQSGKVLLLQEKETNELLVQEKVFESTHKKAQIHELQQNVKSLESALERMTLEIDSEVQRRQKEAQEQEQSIHAELQKLQKILEIKEREINRVKKLARNILEERTEVESFFLEALGQVKQEIISSRNYYRHVAQDAYLNKMMHATIGTDQYPKIRTFQNKEHSTNDVHHDLKEAEKWTHLRSGKVDIRDLTWEQKEKVLRLLFAKMNGFKIRKPSPGLVPAVTAPSKVEAIESSRFPEEKPDVSDTIFITQQVPEYAVPTLALPHIHDKKMRGHGQRVSVPE